MKIELNISDKNEGTAAPFWVIIDPYTQMFKLDYETVASMVKGLFFSREEAKEYLKNHRYNFTKRAVVYCMSGHYGQQYRDACKYAERGKNKDWKSKKLILTKNEFLYIIYKEKKQY